MSAQENTKLVQDAYAAFGRGDVPALLAMMTDDVDWHAAVGVGPNVPSGGPRHGRDEVGKFFKQVADSIDFKQFEPREFVAERDKVVALGFYHGVARPTGRAFKSDWVMVFTHARGKGRPLSRVRGCRRDHCRVLGAGMR